MSLTSSSQPSEEEEIQQWTKEVMDAADKTLSAHPDLGSNPWVRVVVEDHFAVDLSSSLHPESVITNFLTAFWGRPGSGTSIACVETRRSMMDATHHVMGRMEANDSLADPALREGIAKSTHLTLDHLPELRGRVEAEMALARNGIRLEPELSHDPDPEALDYWRATLGRFMR